MLLVNPSFSGSFLSLLSTCNRVEAYRVKPVTQGQSEVRFVADQALLDRMEQIKGLLAIKTPI
jgi:glutamyl-tRNA reductase